MVLRLGYPLGLSNNRSLKWPVFTPSHPSFSLLLPHSSCTITALAVPGKPPLPPAAGLPLSLLLSVLDSAKGDNQKQARKVLSREAF